MTNGAAALFMRTAYQTAAIYFGDTPLGGVLVIGRRPFRVSSVDRRLPLDLARLTISGPIVHESLADDLARVVLARVVLLPVDVVELGPHLLAQLHLGCVCQTPDLLDHPGELRGVLRHPLRTDHEQGCDDEDDELPAVDVEHCGPRVCEVAVSWPLAESS